MQRDGESEAEAREANGRGCTDVVHLLGLHFVVLPHDLQLARHL